MSYNLTQWKEGWQRYYEKLSTLPQPTVPSFAQAVTLDNIHQLNKQYNQNTRSSHTITALNVPWIIKGIEQDLRDGKRIPIEWFTLLPCLAPAKYYKEQGTREVGCVRIHLMDSDWYELDYPRHYIGNGLSLAKYLRIGNVNDVFCLPPTDRVKASWGVDTLTEAVEQHLIKRCWIVEGIKKAQYLMENTDDYAVAVSGCNQFTDGKNLLPTVAWLSENQVHFKLLADVDYISNPNVSKGVNYGIKVMTDNFVSVELYRTLSQPEALNETKMIDTYSISNVAPSHGTQKESHFKWDKSGVDDVSCLPDGSLPVKKVPKKGKLSDAPSPKDLALSFLRSCSMSIAVVLSTNVLYYYDDTTEQYCQVVKGSLFHRRLLAFCSVVLQSEKVTNANLFMKQVWEDLPVVAMLATDILSNVTLISPQELAENYQPISLKGAGLIDSLGYIQDSPASVFTTKSINVSMIELSAAYSRMEAQDWKPLRDLADRLDIANIANILGVTPLEATKQIAQLEILLPAMGGSRNGTEAIFFQSCCSGSGKTVTDKAISRLIGVENVATNINVDGLATNRFARFELVDKLLATSSDINTISEAQETAIRNSFGNTIVEQKNQEARKCELTPVFRFSSNYDKPYTADVAGAMGRRTIIKRYIKPLLEETWSDDYEDPTDMYWDLYAALLYEALVTEMSRRDVDQLFKRVAAACSKKVQPVVANTGELVVDRACVYTGKAESRITMMHLHSIAICVAPLYGIGSAKNVLNLADSLRAMEIKRSTEQAQKEGLPPIKLEWDSYMKDWALIGFDFDEEWLVQLAKDTLEKHNTGNKAAAALGILAYFQRR
jgi:hypothetical protein